MEHAIYFSFVWGWEPNAEGEGGVEERRAADRGAAAAQLTRGATGLSSLGVPRLYLLGRAVRFLGREEAWAVASGAGAGCVSAARGAAGARAACPLLASLPVLASQTRTRHGSSGSGTIMRVPAELPYCMYCTGAYGLGCTVWGFS